MYHSGSGQSGDEAIPPMTKTEMAEWQKELEEATRKLTKQWNEFWYGNHLLPRCPTPVLPNKPFAGLDRNRSAVSRTLPLFPGEPGPPPKQVSIRTLRTRLWKAALRWYRNEAGYEDVLLAARDLAARTD